MSKPFEKLKEEVRRRGGIVGPNEMPPEIAEAMLEQILDCPLCAELEPRINRSGRQDDH